MRLADHYEGFEIERRFNDVLAGARTDCPNLSARIVRRIIAHYFPGLTENLFKSRPCVRRLRYLGCGCEEDPCPHGDDFFAQGEIYESIEFNGASYTIKGFEGGRRRIGLFHFEVVDAPSREAPACRDHMEGFEREEEYNRVFGEAREECPILKHRTVRQIIVRCDPEVLEGLIERRSCVRKLRYVGIEGHPESFGHSFFVVGEIYESIDFNGGSYTIKGFDRGPIGAGHFEVVKDGSE